MINRTYCISTTGDSILAKSRKRFTGSGELLKTFDLEVAFMVQLRMRFLYKSCACNAVIIPVSEGAHLWQNGVDRRMSKRVSAALKQYPRTALEFASEAIFLMQATDQ